MHGNGQIPATAMATAARMNGDWVTVGDLVEAFRELNHVQKPVAAPARPVMPTAVGDGPSFQAPPRPTKQLEESKIINLNALRAQSDAPADATDSLFLAIQSIREKAQTKAAQAAPVKDNWGELRRPAKKLPPQTALFGALIVVFAISAYGVTRLMSSDDSTAQKAAPPPPAAQPARPRAESTATRPVATGGNKLLDSSGGGAARTVPPVRLQRGGGATRIGDDERHRDDRRNDEAPRGMGGMVRSMPDRGNHENDVEIDQDEPMADGREDDGQDGQGTGQPGMTPGNPGMMGGMNGNEGMGVQGEYPMDNNAQIAEPMDGGVAPDSGSP